MNRVVQCGVVLSAMLLCASGCRENPPAKAEQSSVTNWSPSQGPLTVNLDPAVVNWWAKQRLAAEAAFKKDEPNLRLAKRMAEDFMASQPDAQNYGRSGTNSLIVLGGSDDYYDVEFAPKTSSTGPALVRVGINSARRYETELLVVQAQILKEAKSLSDFCTRLDWDPGRKTR